MSVLHVRDGFFKCKSGVSPGRMYTAPRSGWSLAAERSAPVCLLLEDDYYWPLLQQLVVSMR